MADWLKAREGMLDAIQAPAEASYRVVPAAHAGELVRAGPGGGRMASKARTRQVLLSLPEELFESLGNQPGMTRQKSILLLLEYAVASLEAEGLALESIR